MHVYIGVLELTMAEKRATPARRIEKAVIFKVVGRKGLCCGFHVSWGVQG